MRVFRKLALGASVFALAVSACTTGGGGSTPGASTGATTGPTTAATTAPSATIKIGSDDFDEAKVVAEIYGQALEAAGFSATPRGLRLRA